MFNFLRKLLWRVLAFFTGGLPRAFSRPTGWNEVKWAAMIAKNIDGVAEHRLDDGTRVDILTTKHAIEVDWTHKWAECIGQALYYALCTERVPVCLFLVKAPVDELRYFRRCQFVADTVSPKIELWMFDTVTGVLTTPAGSRRLSLK